MARGAPPRSRAARSRAPRAGRRRTEKAQTSPQTIFILILKCESLSSRGMSEWTTQTLTELQRAGYRSGGARRAVIQLLGRQECCLSAQEIFDGLRAEGRGVGIASVYRILELLAEQGFVQRVEIGD